MSGKKKTQGIKGRQTTGKTPKKNKVDSIPDMTENEPTPEKKSNLSTSLVLESLPREIEDLNLCKTLQDLAVSIKNATTTNVFRNEEVVNNFRDAQQIYEGWTTPQKQPTQSSKGMKRKRSDLVANGDDSIKTLEARNVELEEMVRKLENEKNELRNELTQTKQMLQDHDKTKTESTKKDKLIKGLNEELEKLKLKLTNESMAYKKTKDEETMGRDELKRVKQELSLEKDTSHSHLKKVQAELQQKNYEIQKKNEELENLGNDIIKRSTYIEEIGQQSSYLKKQISQLQSELDTKNEETNDLRNRLSSLSASKLDGDPNIADLGDPDRPLKLVERYQLLYDNLWTDVFDELMESYKDVEDDSEKEKRAASDILAIFKDVLLFCQNMVEDQEKSVVSTLTSCSKEDVDAHMGNIDLSAIRNIRKTNAKRALPYLNQIYAKQNGHDLSKCLKDFTEECLAICWLSLVHDPPMEYEFDYSNGATVDKDIMREFTVSGQLVDFVVWPTLRLHKGGPLMVKSVVQPIKKGH